MKVITNVTILRQITKHLRNNSQTFTIRDSVVTYDKCVLRVVDGYVIASYFGERVFVYQVHYVSASEWHRKFKRWRSSFDLVKKANSKFHIDAKRS